ncbi:MAG TPA: hypothetical protein VFE47_26965 [Tepidisphaeraceae bacterium]|jgi:hypothetical protein|nr:hypothetical protein [Tepidisphaeraceae bacterium]
MRSKHFNFAIAIAVSAAAHLLLWPAAKRIKVPSFASGPRVTGEVTLVLNDPQTPSDHHKAPAPLPDPPKPKPKPTPPPPPPPKPKPKPKPSVVEPPDDMGEAHAKGTGAQAAKGADLLRAPEADQDQAFLSRDPVGMGRVGDPPTFYTGPRGQDGSGGQVGGAQVAFNPAHSMSPDDRHPPDESSRQEKASDDQEQTRPPRQSPVHLPEPQKPSVNPPKDVAPPPSETASVGAAPAEVNLPPRNQVKPHGPLAQVATASDADLQLPPEVGPTTMPVKASSTAPPTKPDAPVDHMAVALGPQLQIPAAAVAEPPPPAVEVHFPKPQVKPAPVTPPQPAPSPAPVAQAVITTGDGRAPGKDRAAADPAQESDSESDAFAKKLVSSVLHDGRLEVRNGRKVKTTRPQILPGAFAAFLSNPEPPVVVFKVSIDATGKVIHVDPIRSSGSEEIDQPCRVAMYDWWFEPSHDKQGRAVPDVLPFEIRFR